LARRHAQQLCALQLHGTAGSGQLPADHIEGGGLAGSVRPDQRQQLALVQIKPDIINRSIAAEPPDQATYFKESHVASWLPANHPHIRQCLAEMPTRSTKSPRRTRLASTL